VSKYAESAWLVRASVAAILGTATLFGFSSRIVAAEAEEEDELEEVQVTGTRIQLPGYNSPNPITSVTGEEMRQQGIVNIADALMQLIPQNQSSYNDFSVSDTRSSINGSGVNDSDFANRGQYFIGNTIANLRGLDPAFGSRTLTLVDGRRMVSSSTQGDVVDLNVIPSNLLQRMDVVTGGASATYGSGAMAGVVNLVLNNRLIGYNIDMDYGVNEAGDGASPHLALSGGTALFGGRGHVLLGAEWQKTDAIQDCAAARAWCAESRTLFENGSASNGQATPPESSTLTGQVPGFETAPARFQMANMRYNQWSENGAIIVQGQTGATTGFKFTSDGLGVTPYSLGYRGGASAGFGGMADSVMNGDGPLTTSGTSMRSGNQRKTGFANFEFNFTERTTGYLQANYAKTEGTNLNTYSTSNNCVRFQTRGQAADAPISAPQGTVFRWTVSSTNNGATPEQNDAALLVLGNASFRAWLGDLPAFNGGFNFVNPYWPGFIAGTPLYPISGPPPPDPNLNPPFNFGGKAVGHWRLGGGNNEYGGSWFWFLDGITITDPVGYADPGKPAVLPELQGRDANAFLAGLSAQAQEQLQLAGVFKTPTGSIPGNAPGTASTPDYLTGTNACAGFAAIRKVWSSQFRRSTENEAETMGSTLGVRGRFGRDWRWDAYYQYGRTKNFAVQHNTGTTIRLAFATDAVIDDRQLVDGESNLVADGGTYGQPVCRVVRDGVPVLSTNGAQLSDAPGVKALAAGCEPLNILGSLYTDPAAALRQQAAIRYAFVDNATSGETTQQTLSFNTSGTLWQGWGAGPVTGAFGLELRENEVDNSGSLGNYYERSDISGAWSDAFGGRTRLTEAFSEFNVPLVSGIEGINLLSLNTALRYSSINNKGGTGTTGQSLTQETTQWRVSLAYEPFDFVRFRVTRTHDMRAAGYRDLFLNQPSPGGPDFLEQANPWRPYDADATVNTLNRGDRMGSNTVGNPNLKPEQSDTLGIGMVISPSGWAQGMRMTVDYQDVKVTDGIFTSYADFTGPINVCWQESGNNDPGRNRNGDPDPTQTGHNGEFDETNPACRKITFAEQLDADGKPIPGTRDLGNIVTYSLSTAQNNRPYRRRNLDVGLQYNFPLSRAFETLPGSMSLVLRGTKALESSGSVRTLGQTFTDSFTYVDVVGQIRTNTFVPGVTPTPEWMGNFTATYLLGDFTGSLRANYVGGAKLDKLWGDSPDDANYQDAFGTYLYGSVDNNQVKPYVNFALNASYNLKIANAKQFQVFGSINNLLDKSPPWSAGYVSGASPQYHDTMGRAYRMGVRMRF
jgi:outer membrane receptor protein involved in Fe transport